MKHTLRALGRSPGFAGSGVLVLAIGLAGSTLVFSLTRALLVSPLEYRDPATLAQLRERDAEGNLAPLTVAELRAAQRRSDRVTGVAAVDLGMFLLTGVAEPEQFAGAAITPNTLELLGTRPALGHELTADRPDEVLLTHAAWMRRFGGDPAILGKTIDLDWARTPQPERYRVAGVLPPRFWLAYRGIEVFIPLTDRILDGAGPRRRYLAIARLAPAAAVPFALPLEQPGATLMATSLERDLTEDSRPALLLLSAAAGLLALLASVNAANLFLARGLARRDEYAVRMALGASRWQVARMVVGEALVVSAVAAALAIPLARFGLMLLRGRLPGDAGWAQFTPGFEKIAIDSWAAAFTAGAALVCCLLAAMAPARACSAAPSQARGSTGRRSYRPLLIGAESALAMVLLCGAGLLMRSGMALDRADLGFARERLLVARVPRVGGPAGPRYYEELRRRIEALPGVEAVTFTSYQPLTNTRPSRRFAIASGAEDTASYCVVASNFFATYGIALREGRGFTAADRAGAPPVMVVSESLARKHFNGRTAVGERIQLAGDAAPSEIVGVVEDVQQSLRRAAPPTVYRPAAQDTAAGLQMGVRTLVAPLRLAPAIRREIGASGGATAELTTAEAFVAGESWQTAMSGALLAGFSGLALAIAGFGMFSVLAYAARQRKQEMGIRSALGARPADLARLVAVEGLRPTAAGLLTGLGGALALSRSLKGLLYGVGPGDVASYTIAAGALLLAAVLAIIGPAMLAARSDPAKSLRNL